MVDSFFASARPAKRKRPSTDGKPSRGGRGGHSSARGQSRSNGPAPSNRRKRREDSIEGDVGPTMNADSDEEDEERRRAATPLAGSDEEDDERETANQKRLRLAKTYIASLEEAQQRDAGDIDAADLDRDLIAERLQEDVLAESGDVHVFLADQLAEPLPADLHYTSTSKGHRLPLTAAVASSDGRHLYTASKDGSLIKWDLSSAFTSSSGTLKRLVYCPKHVASKSTAPKSVKGKQVEQGPTTIGHSGEILTLSISEDNEHLASGGTDRLVGVWNVEGAGCVWRGGLRGHKDTVGAIAFRKGSTQAYTSAYDRTLKVFDLASLSYIETLFGHQDRIHDIDCLKGEMPISAGGRDKTLRMWKVSEESQLVFRAGVTSRIREVIENGMVEEDEEAEAPTKETRYIEGSTDCVAMIDDGHFLSGGDSGSICLWTTTRKKPIFTLPLAHGLDEHVSETEGMQKSARWITSLACLPYGDLFASGSWDGFIRLWKLDRALRTFSPLFVLPAVGFVNSLHLSSAKTSKEVILAAALGQEPRLGRWMRKKEARNVALVVKLGPRS